MLNRIYILLALLSSLLISESLSGQTMIEGPISVSSLELPAEAIEDPIVELSRLVLGFEVEGSLVYVMAIQGEDHIRFRRLDRPDHVEQSILDEWTSAFSDGDARLREGTELGDFGIDLVSREEVEPSNDELRVYREALYAFVRDERLSEQRLRDMPSTALTIRSIKREGLEVRDRRQVATIKIPQWRYSFSFIEAFKLQGSNQETKVLTLRENEVVAIISLVDDEEPMNSFFATVSMEDGVPLLKPIEGKRRRALHRLLSNSPKTSESDEEFMSYLSQLFRWNTIISSHTDSGSDEQIQFRITRYDVPQPQKELIKGLQERLQAAWLAGRLGELELSASPSQIREALQGRQAEVIPLVSAAPESCRSRLVEASEAREKKS